LISASDVKNGAVSATAKSTQDENKDDDAFTMEFRIEDIAVTGVLASQPDSRDIKIDQANLLYCGHVLVEDANLEFNYGNRYGLLGENGCGKSTLLQVLAAGEWPIPKWIDIHLLHKEVAPSDMSALESVIVETRKEIARLETLQLDLLEQDPDSPTLMFIDEKLEELDPDTLEPRAATLLHGLGFDVEMQQKATKDMSGGWRMRVALARALFCKPTLLLLDEPTNHLDLEACVWLEDYLASYPHILVIVSHSQDFLNNVCTHTIHFQAQKLTYYGGNYDTFIKTKSEQDTNQIKAYKKQQAEIKHMKEFISSCGTFSNMVRQAKSRQKIIDKMVADGLYTMPLKEKTWNFDFPDCEKLPPPVLAFHKVKFGYPKSKILYDGVSFGVDCDSRVALVGKNGTGKSTLLKLMCDDLQPLDGTVSRHAHLKFGRYHQHLAEILPMEKSVLEFVQTAYADRRMEVDAWRGVVGRYGITSKNQVLPMGHLSDGQRSRVVFMLMCLESPNMLLLDEPTNHLDIGCIDALADAIKGYNGGLVLVSHDFRLIDQVAKEIWLCEDNKITPFTGDIHEYKLLLKQHVHAENQKFAQSPK